MEEIMNKMNVKKFAAAALLGIFAVGSGFAAWSAAASPAAARHGSRDDGWHRTDDRPYHGDRYYGDRYNRQPGDNAPERPNS